MANLLSALPAAAAFLALNLTGLLFAYGPHSIALFWPGNGFLLAMLMVAPRERRLPLLALAFPAVVAVNLTLGRPLLPGLAFSAVNTLEFLLALRLLRGIPGGARFLGDQRGVLRFFLPITATAAAGALAGGFVATVWFGGGFLRHAATWFVVDAASLAAVTPTVLAWIHREFAWPPGWRRTAEFAACMGVSVLVAFSVFARPELLWNALGHPMSYLAFPPMVWAAIRFGARGSSTVVLVIYVISAWYTSRGHGPFAAAGGTGSLFLPMQLLPYAGAFCSLLPAVLFHVQKRTERDLRNREARFRDLWGSRLIGIFVSDFSGRIIEANDAFLAMIKRTRADLEAGAVTSADMATPEYLDGAARRRGSFQAEGRMGPYDREWVLADGSRLNTLFFATRMEDTGSALCMVVDTDELMRTKSELRAVESRFKSLFDSNIIGVAVAVAGKDIVEANDTFLGMIGYSREDLEAGRITGRGIQSPDDTADRQAMLAMLERTGRLDPRETEFLRKDGGRVHVYRGVARLDGTGKVLLIAIDISVLKRTQAELERAMTAARTASLAKSDFLAHMSHEIRTPMHGVLGTLALLQGTRLDAEQQSYARTCRESGEHLLGLINQVLDVSRIENGAMELDSSEFPLGAMVEGALAPLQEAAQKKGLELVKRMQPGLPAYFRGDPMRMQQILLNLIGNAVKFSERGEVSVSVRLKDRQGDACRLEFEIADRGPGIAPEALATLFRPFRQGDESLSRKAGGTGLGLAICKELVGRMGGRIEVDSRPGEGSRFRFDVLLEAAPAPAGDPRRAEARGEGLTARILEPHPDHRDHLADLLGGWGFRVLPASTPEEFLAAVSGGADPRPDLAVLAVSMQEGTAASEAEAIAACRNAGIPVLCTLPFITQSRGAGLLEAGAAGILTKPFRGADVQETLRSLLPGWKGAPGRAHAHPGAGQPAGPAHPPGTAAAMPPEWAGPPRVLVVDDHPVNLTVATSMLAKLGCRVETAQDGPSALETISRTDFDIVFMDCQMPGMDGFEATRRLRKLEAPGCRVPVIALTAHAVNGFRDRCISEGLDDYLSKPFSPGDLADALKAWIPARFAGPRRGVAAVAPTGTVRGADPGGETADDGARAAEGCVDWSRIDSLGAGILGGEEKVRKLIDLFLDTSRAGLESIRQAHLQDRREELSRALHKLKGSCGTLGALAMFSLIGELEKRTAAGRMEALPEGLARLEREFSRTAEELRKRA